jgi:hypothetical protein
MNFLELARMTVQQSGTIQGPLPTTVIGQANRLKLIIDYVPEAYLDIQNAHRAWRWLNSRFTGSTVASTWTYAATSFTDEISNTPITRFSQWGFKQDGTDLGLTMYLTSAGAAEEGPLRWLDFDRFYDTQKKGVQTPGKPQFFTVTNDNKLALSPIPDAVYTIRGRYRKSAQTLTLDADIPEMPVEFHTIIKDAALAYLEGFDEGPRIPVYRLRMLPNWSMLENQQLPQVTWGAPLA